MLLCRDDVGTVVDDECKLRRGRRELRDVELLLPVGGVELGMMSILHIPAYRERPDLMLVCASPPRRIVHEYQELGNNNAG